MDQPPRRRTWLAIGVCAGGAVGFPLGLSSGRPDVVERPTHSRVASGAVRDIFSPEPRSDPQVLDGWRRTVEAMEAGCRATGAQCDEARAARERLSELQRGH